MEKEGVGVEVEGRLENIGYCPYEGGNLEISEGSQIETLKNSSIAAIPDPDKWLDEEIKRNILLTTLDWAVDWARRSSLWTAVAFPACCAMEFMSAMVPRFDLARFGMELMRSSPRQADLMITAGTLTWKMAPQIKRIFEQMAEPKWVIGMGACACSGGTFANSYSVVPGYNKIIPVDVYVPGCPPRPEGLIYGIQMLQKKIAKEHVNIKIPGLKE
jgi:NADH-quinone oxidoreductase subunit B